MIVENPLPLTPTVNRSLETTTNKIRSSAGVLISQIVTKLSSRTVPTLQNDGFSDGSIASKKPVIPLSNTFEASNSLKFHELQKQNALASSALM